MKRYIRLFTTFAKISLIRNMEFKSNFLMTLALEVAWTMVTFFTITIVFSQTNSMGGWSKGEVFLIYALFRLSSALSAMFTRINIEKLPELINTGEFDFVLVKPVNHFFLTIFRHMAIDRISQLIAGLLLVWYSYTLMQLPLTIFVWIQVIMFAIIGTVIRTAISLLIHLPSFKLQQVQNFLRLELTFTTTARFPRIVYPVGLRFFLSFIVPVLFIAAVPAELILGKSSLFWLGLLLGTAIGLGYLSYSLFNLALKYYSSASS